MINPQKRLLMAAAHRRMPKDTRLRAYKSNAQAIGNNAYIKVNLDATEFDAGGNFNTATGEFTAPSDGVYAVCAQAALTHNLESGDVRVAVFKNGAFYSDSRARIKYDSLSITYDGQYRNFSFAQLSGGDTLDMRLYKDGGTLVTGAINTFFCVLGPFDFNDMFRVSMSADQGPLGNFAMVRANMDTVDFDKAGTFDTVNHLWDVAENGIYWHSNNHLYTDSTEHFAWARRLTDGYSNEFLNQIFRGGYDAGKTGNTSGFIRPSSGDQFEAILRGTGGIIGKAGSTYSAIGPLGVDEACWAWPSGGVHFTGYTYGIWNKLRLDTLEEAGLGNFDTVNHKYVVSRAGYYWITQVLRHRTNSSNNYQAMELRKNGAVVARSGYVDDPNGAVPGRIMDQLIFLEVGDELEMWFKVTQTNTSNIHGFRNTTNFQIFGPF